MIRLQKIIAASGLASRRAAETMIRNGEVTVNGAVVRVLGTCVDPLTDHVKVNGRHVGQAEPEVFMLLHKPAGYVTTMRDPHGRRTIADLLDGVKVRVVPVGRLDYDAEGLLLLTNNGKVAQACLHPRYHVPKTYLVKLSGLCTDEELRTLQDGVALDDGMTAPAGVRKSGKAKVNSWLELTIHEGKKHQVKRMIEALGHRVLRIKRICFGPLMLGALRVGTCRFTTDGEANALRALLRQPARARIRRQAFPSRATVFPKIPRSPVLRSPTLRSRSLRPKKTVSSARIRKTGSRGVVAQSPNYGPPARTRKPVLPSRPKKTVSSAHTRKTGSRGVAAQSPNYGPPARTRKPVLPSRPKKTVSSAHTRKTGSRGVAAQSPNYGPSARMRKPMLPLRPKKTVSSAHTRKTGSRGVAAQSPNYGPPARMRKPVLPSRRNADSRGRRSPAGRVRGTRHMAKSRRPHGRKKTR